jgi:hypothetical protein
VTDVRCTCRYLQCEAEEPESPILFDAETREYHFACGGNVLVIYHCPFCGGAAPPSQRPLLFAAIPAQEQERLARLLRPVRSVRSALKRLGKPDADDPGGVRTTDKRGGDHQPALKFHRLLVYERLSPVADVWIIEWADRSVHWQLMGKYIGPPK